MSSFLPYWIWKIFVIVKIYYKNIFFIYDLGEFFGDYTVVTVDEYFEILDKEAQKRAAMVATSLTKYLRRVQESNKYNTVNAIALH